MKSIPFDLSMAMKRFNFQPVELAKNARYEVGKTYWCTYWSKWYKVIGVKYKPCGHLQEVTVVWENTVGERIGRQRK